MKKETEQQEESMVSTPIILSYSWIGDPPTLKTGVIGHDTQAPMMMAAHVGSTHQIIFWCLDQYADFYRDAFKLYPIQVQPIIAYLNECSLNPLHKDAALKVIYVINTLLIPERNTIRDRVTVKEIFSLFLLMTIGDYVLDSNVRPGPEKQVKLTRFDTFCAPLVLEKQDNGLVDVWAMFSPTENNRAANKAFNYFYDTWIAREGLYEIEAYSTKYYKQIGSIITSSIKHGAAQETIIYWDSNKINQIATVSALNIEKYYFNTHTYPLRSEYEDKETLTRDGFIQAVATTGLTLFSTTINSLIYDYLSDEEGKAAIQKTFKIPSAGSEFSEVFYVAAIGDCKRMRELIGLNVDINQQIWRKDRLGETPLHLALCNKHFEMTTLLLENNASVDLVAKYHGKPKEWKAYDLILALPTENREKFIHLYDSVMANRDNTQKRSLAR